MLITKSAHFSDEEIKHRMDFDFTIDPDGSLSEYFEEEGISMEEDFTQKEELYLLRLYQEVVEKRIRDIQNEIMTSRFEDLENGVKRSSTLTKVAIFFIVLLLIGTIFLILNFVLGWNIL